MDKITSVKATGEWVVCLGVPVVEKQTKTTSGLITGKKSNGQSVGVNGGQKTVYDFKIFDIGPEVPKDKISYKKDDFVILDGYDMQGFGDDDTMYVVCHYTKIKAIVKF
jgi:co-chaperonin GroES (HSP10)